ncbi:hypothetical protein [uncultured Aquimonas sp.]|jgi:hypothetical protein|uniref:hypothetical protein n=1 Tax=uncultured Aquimonas sp. TaxID=385483 RepID=UPI00086DFF2C|nr:hypothetical protein [uncultured Aquimonas sp.]ODU45223.1 MAG: hypothetical protein ABS96_14235 [Xanthomonadaceae bacterium SCN 69-123]
MFKPKTLTLAFVAGFLATLFFHQGGLWLLGLTGRTAAAAWNLTPVGPLGVPSVLSLAFWGGLWGIALWALIRRSAGARFWMLAIVLGALLPSLVAWFVVFPLKGIELSSPLIIGALILNGLWGLGVAVYMRLFRA